jgi:ribonuclease HI
MLIEGTTCKVIIKSILHRIDKIQEPKLTCNIHIEWMSGHKNIEGNEQADQAAMVAAISSTMPPIIRMKSTQNRSIQSMIKIK